MADTSIQIADVVVVATVAVSGLWALTRGFVREVLGAGSWLLALFCALYGYEKMLGMLGGIGNELVRNIAAFCIVFVGVLTTALVITERIADRVDDGALNSLDQTLGGVFGVLRGMVIVCLCYLIAASFSDTKDDLPGFVRNARTLPLVDGGAQILVSLLPRKLERRAERSTNIEDDLPDEERENRRDREKERDRENEDDDRPKSSLQQTLDRLRHRDAEREKPAAEKSAPTKDPASKDKQSLDNLIDSIQ